MQQISTPLLQGANSTNPMRDAYDSRAAINDQKALQEQKQKDEDFHTVMKYASEGLADEARYFAKQKGFNVPDGLINNAEASFALKSARDMYEDDPDAAKRYAIAYMSAQGDRLTRYGAGLSAGGKPRTKDEKELELYAKKLAIHQKYSSSGSANKGFTLGAGQTRYDVNGNVIAGGGPPISRYEAVSKAYTSAVSSGLKNDSEARAAAEEAGKMWDAEYGSQARPTQQMPNMGGGVTAPQGGYGAIPQLTEEDLFRSAQPQSGTPSAPVITPQYQQQSGLVDGGQYGQQQIDPNSIYQVVSPRDGKTYNIRATDLNEAVQSGAQIVGVVPQQQTQRELPPLRVEPMSQQPEQATSPYEYKSFGQNPTPMDKIYTSTYNMTNLPAHAYNAGKTAYGIAERGGRMINGLVDIGIGAGNAISDKLQQRDKIIVYNNNGQGYYVPRERLNEALSMGYSLDPNPNAPQVPIAY